MGLRAKLAIVFIPLLVASIIVVSVAAIDHTVGVMARNLADSGTLLVNQTFEQVRLTLSRARGRGNPARALAEDRSLSALLASSEAFAKGIVYARVETISGGFIAGSPHEADEIARLNPEPFNALFARSSRWWWPLPRLRALASGRVYEIREQVTVNERPAAVIRVGLSTGLIARDVRRGVVKIAVLAAVVMALALGGAFLFGALLLKPVAVISAGLERLAAGGELADVAVDSQDELWALAEKFNVLAERVQSERAQWEGERGQLMKAFRSAADAVLLVGGDGLVLFSNEEGYSPLGLPASEVARGRPLASLLGQEHPLVRLVREGSARGAEVREVGLEDGGAGGGPVHLMASVFPLANYSGAPVLAIVRDLKTAQELENVVDDSGRLARVGGLISGVVHQIRNLLNSMTLELEMLSQEAGKSRPVDERIRSVREEMHRLDEAIVALMRFMRPERLKIEAVEPGDLLGELTRDIQQSAAVLDWRLDSNCPPIMADRLLLREACRNVLRNAVEAMPNGGILTLSSRVEKDGFVVLSITDTGEGIPSEILDHVFELYYTTKKGGSGVGLSLALRAVDLLGGTMKIESQVGKGSTVFIRMPAAASPSPKATSAPSARNLVPEV